MNQPELARPTRRNRCRPLGHAPGSSAARQVSSARVTVAWTPAKQDSASAFAPLELELVAGPETEPKDRTWTGPEGFGSNWLDAIASARCSEVLLTARLGDDVPAKHFVLELAQRLAFTLSDSQPLIRVRFLSSPRAPRHASRHA
ncbi:MAG TPA: hypothetical protein VGC79_34495 [Polyangiaceae bacterium]